MDISGSYTLKAPRERVWESLLDPDMLQRTIPGCEKLEQIGPDEWRMRVNIGIAAVKGVYEGTLRMTDRVPPETYRMVADGTGARSVLHGEGTLALDAPDPNTTVVNYQGAAQINGPLAGIANRVAPSVSKMLLKQFFGRFQQELDAIGASAPVVAATPSADDAIASAGAAAAVGSESASAAPAPAPAAAATEPQGADIVDASTSGVWEMSLPEARPLDDEQAPAAALPLDPADAAPSATADATASVAAAAAPSAVADAPAAAAPTEPAPDTPATPSATQPADQPATTITPASPAPVAKVAATASTSAAATMSTGQRAGGGFMAWLMRLFGRAR